MPGGGGGIPGGVNAPVASRREPAGTTEGGDHLPRRCQARGETCRVEIPLLKSRISNLSDNQPFPAKNRSPPTIKQFPYPYVLIQVKPIGLRPILRKTDKGDHDPELDGLPQGSARIPERKTSPGRCRCSSGGRAREDRRLAALRQPTRLVSGTSSDGTGPSSPTRRDRERGSRPGGPSRAGSPPPRTRSTR